MSYLSCIHSMCISFNDKDLGNRLFFTGISILFFCALLSGCATVSVPPPNKADNVEINKQSVPVITAHPAIQIAEQLKGKPYRYGGVTPKGFDCSGFVHYAYRKAGITIPRTTKDQYRTSQRLPIEQARSGDLLFFKINSRKLSHVGLYAGNGRFIHASTTQNSVSDASLNDPYWQERLIAVGRIH